MTLALTRHTGGHGYAGMVPSHAAGLPRINNYRRNEGTGGASNAVRFDR